MTTTHDVLDALELEEAREAYAASAATIARLRKERDFARWAMGEIVKKMVERDAPGTKRVLDDVARAAREARSTNHGR